jgi:hypothetical protein
MNDLAGGVHTGVGAARTHDIDTFIGNPRKRLLEALLYAQAGQLTLPAVVTRTVVLYAERDANETDRKGD